MNISSDENLGHYLSLDQIDEHFPSETYRPLQRESIVAICDAFNTGKKLVIAEMATGSGKCLDSETLVLFKDGRRIKIADLNKHIGEELLCIDSSLQNNFCKLVDHCHSGTKDCYEITTSSGRRITSTLEHRFLDINGWKTLGEMNVGDYLAVNASHDIRATNNSFTTSEAELIGILLGDDNFCRNGSSVLVCISTDEPELHERVNYLIKTIDPMLRLSTADNQTRKGINYRIVRNEQYAGKNNVTNEVVKLIKEIGLTGMVGEHKFIPNEIFSSTKEIWKALILGLWESDGWMSVLNSSGNRPKKYTIGFTNKSYHLAHGLQHLLLRFGITSRIRYRMMLCSTNRKRFPSYQVEIRTSSIERFVDEFSISLFSVGCKPLPIGNTISSRNRNRNADLLVPGSIWTDVDHAISASGVAINIAMPHKLRKKSTLSTLLKRMSNTNKHIIKHIGLETKCPKLMAVGNSDVIWDQIVSIKHVGARETYDIEVSSINGYEPNFSANDIVTHNSMIATTLCNMHEQAYYITATKILQDQIEKDFDGDNFVTLKGKSNYKCNLYDRNQDAFKHITCVMTEEELAELRCDTGLCTQANTIGGCPSCFDNRSSKLYKGHLPVLPPDRKYSACEYYDRVEMADNAKIASMNFDNFILHLNYNHKAFGKRDLLVIDEGHVIEDKVLDFLGSVITSSLIETAVPKLDSALDYVQWFMSSRYFEFLQERYEMLIKKKSIKQALKLSESLKKLAICFCDIRKRPEYWVAEHESKGSTSKVDLKPVIVGDNVYELLFSHADRVLILSATILDPRHFKRSLEISDGESAFILTPSTFDPKRMPIHLDYAGTFTGGKGKMDEWIGQMAKKIVEICKKHDGKKGMLHTHSFSIQQALLSKLPKEIISRILTQEMYPDKKELLKVHQKSKDSIIVAPGMHEGLDLKDDLCRFNVVCKIPYANYFDDKRLAKRMEIDKDYYSNITIKKIVQSIGRGMRSQDDYVNNYIIDGHFEVLYKRSKTKFPKWFSEAIVK